MLCWSEEGTLYMTTLMHVAYLRDNIVDKNFQEILKYGDSSLNAKHGYRTLIAEYIYKVYSF